MKNIVVMVIDSLRFDGIAYNQRRVLGIESPSVSTPNLDDWAFRGTCFPDVYSSNSCTTAAHATLFTGNYPAIHDICGFFDFNQKLNPDIPTLAEKLGELGFNTFFYTDIKELFSEMNIWRGFQYKTYGKLNWLWNTLDSNKAQKNFIFIHLFDVHEPYLLDKDGNCPINSNRDYFLEIQKLRQKLHFKSKINEINKPFAAWAEIKKQIINQGLSVRDYMQPIYYKGIEKFDRLKFPLIIKQLSLLGIKDTNSFIYLLADHGEGATVIGDRSSFHHSGELTEEVIKIPLIINQKFENKPDCPIGLIDIFNLVMGTSLHQIEEIIKKFNHKHRLVYSEYIEIDKRGFRLVDNNTERLLTAYKKEVLIKRLKQRVLISKNFELLMQSNSLVITPTPEKCSYHLYNRHYPFNNPIKGINALKELLLGKFPISEGALISKSSVIKSIVMDIEFVK